MHKKQNLKNKAKVVQPISTSFSKLRLVLLISSIILICFFSFSPATKNSFINQDDNIYVFDNDNLSKPIPEAIVYFFQPHFFSGNYIPITMICYALAYHAAGITPGYFHTLSIFIHLGNVILVFCFIYLLSRKKPLVAAITALLFGIHPMHVESVAWVAELKDVLYSFFFLAGLIVYYKYIELSTNQNIINRKKDFFKLIFIVFIFFIISILCKPAAIIFPVVLILLDFYYGRKFDKWVWLEKLPYFIVSVVFGVIAIIAQQADKLINNQYSLVQKLFITCYALLEYLEKFFLPINLSNFYPYPSMKSGQLPYNYYLAPVMVIILFYGMYKTLKYSRLITFGFLFFIVNIVLVLQFLSVGNAFMADRYTYVPYIGLFYIVGMGFEQVYHATNKKLKAFKPYAIAIIIVLSTAYAFLTYQRCLVWENQDTIASDVLKKYPNDPIALNNKGYLLFMKGDYQEAIKLFKRAIQLKPDYKKSEDIKVYVNLANTYLALNDYNNAMKTTDSAMQYAPQDYIVYNFKGFLYCKQNNYTDGLKFYRESIRLKADNIEGYISLAMCYYKLNDYDNWEKTLDIGLKYDSANYILLNNKGYYLLVQGKYNDAIQYFKESLNIKPDFTTATENLSACYRALKDTTIKKN